jgi:hypothetical protein
MLPPNKYQTTFQAMSLSKICFQIKKFPSRGKCQLILRRKASKFVASQLRSNVGIKITALETIKLFTSLARIPKSIWIS